MYTNAASQLESHAFACLAYGVIGDAMGTPTENLEPAQIEERFGWVESFEGDGTDDTIMRDLLAAALIRTGGFADADGWAEEWRDQRDAIFGSKVGRFFPSVLHAAAKLRFGYLPRSIVCNGTVLTGRCDASSRPGGTAVSGWHSCNYAKQRTASSWYSRVPTAFQATSSSVSLRTSRAGAPVTSVRGGTTNPARTKLAAPTSASSPTTTSSISTALIPTSAPRLTVQP